MKDQQAAPIVEKLINDIQQRLYINLNPSSQYGKSSSNQLGTVMVV